MPATIESIASEVSPFLSPPDCISDIKTALMSRIGAVRLAQWFGPQTRFELINRTLVVYAPNAFAMQWIRGHFINDLRAAAVATAGLEAVDIRAGATSGQACVLVPAPGRTAADSAGDTVKMMPSQLSRLNPQFTLERFISGAGNRMARHTAELVAAQPEKVHGPLFVHGNCGLGKTHLLQGICRAFAAHFPLRRWRYITAEQFTNEFLEAIKKSTMNAFRQRMRRIDLLVIDDAHFLNRKASTQQEFLHTFNEITAAGGKVVLAADCAPCDLTDINVALATRLVSGMVVRVDPPDNGTKAAILRQLAQQRGWTISDVMINRLAREPVANVRELEGCLTRTVMRQTLGGCAAADARDDLSLNGGDSLPPAASVDVIVRATAEYLGQQVEKLTSGCRSAPCARARGIAMYLVREMARMSYPEIGRAIGVKSHSAVIAACRRVSDQIAAGELLLWKLDDEMRSATVTQVVGDIMARIRQSPRKKSPASLEPSISG